MSAAAVARPRSSTPERLAALEALVLEMREDVRDLHQVLVLGTDERAPLLERMATVETDLRGLKDWKHRALLGSAQALIGAAVAFMAHATGVQIGGPLAGGGQT